VTKEIDPPYFSVKEAVFPFVKFPAVDPVLGPEMRSTGEVMGVGQTFGEALFKSQLAAGSRLPESGTVLLTVMDADKPKAVEVARMLHELGYPIVATKGTAAAIEAAGVPVKVVNKVKGRPSAHRRHDQERRDRAGLHDRRRNPRGDRRLAFDSHERQANKVTYYTTCPVHGPREGLRYLKNLEVYDLQGLHARLN
jgi:Carbamoylphosphate synthase large subunit (split gene in MJ)